MADQILYGLFVPTTKVYDISQIYQYNSNSPEFKEFIVRLYQDFNDVCDTLNKKESGLYPLQEFVTGEQLFARTTQPISIDQGRGIFRRTYNLGTLANGATITTALGFTVGALWQFVEIQAASTNHATGNHLPIPYVGAAGAFIRLELTNTQLIVENQSGVQIDNIIITLKYTKE